MMLSKLRIVMGLVSGWRVSRGYNFQRHLCVVSCSVTVVRLKLYALVPLKLWCLDEKEHHHSAL